ncbi:hypothetical protein [Immundisolibacter sp.]
MNEQPNFLLIAILYGLLVIISLRYRFYKEKSERLEMENIKLAEKLGKEIGICQYCGQPMVIHNKLQKYHSQCNSAVNKKRVMTLYRKTKKSITGKTLVLKNGVEILLNVVGKEIAGYHVNKLGSRGGKRK